MLSRRVPKRLFVLPFVFSALFAYRTGSGADRLPAMASAASAETPVRSQPSVDGKILWHAWIHTPFKILGSYGAWLKVRDFEGNVGWVREYDLSEDPSVTVRTKRANIREGPGTNYPPSWVVDRGYTMRVTARQGSWLKVDDSEEITGWIHRSVTWGFSERAYGAAG